ncbi:hypothetical protein GCM10007425_16560 [Lysinibacillus alkalisoli]|uniref:DUF3006 domain-containing protein n=1 Tax=Lysinibacillus alkalisoli TaxID=1911548 RepID=A0A917G4H6_9BACI|nr:DUF3006 domain-containing protein [Lysinibacillus alkalisoli]GGG22754.1 hypothetical protein GCM10007425_16560 [Lysinibacillus alkalisoli]
MNSIKYTIDRIEDGYAILLQRDDEEQQLALPATQIPSSLAEGDIVSITTDGTFYCFEAQQDETHQALQDAMSLMAKLRNKHKK